MVVDVGDIRAAIEAKLREVDAIVVVLKQKIADHRAALAEAQHRRDIVAAFYQSEFGLNGSAEADTNEPPLFDMPRRFSQTTVREACRQLLQKRGPCMYRRCKPPLPITA